MANEVAVSSNFLDQLRAWTPVAITLIAALVTATMWLQTNGDNKYLTKESGDNIKEKMVDMKNDIQQIKQQNIEIIQGLASLNAKVEDAKSVKK